MGKRRPKPKLWLQGHFDTAPASTLGLMPAASTLATVQYFCEIDDMPKMQHAVSIFEAVPATLLEIPVSAIKAACMADPEIAGSHATFDDYHRWYMSVGDMPVYGEQSRWPCIAGCIEYEVFSDGWHRLHAYIEAGHASIPVLDFDHKDWWNAHERWKQSNERLPDASKQARERATA